MPSPGAEFPVTIEIGEEVTSDVKVTWGHVLNNGPLAKQRWSRKREFPDYETLCEFAGSQHDAMHDVVIRRDDPEELREMRSWLDEHARRSYAMFGRFMWSTTGATVQRKLDGLLFKFKDPDIAFFFKMRWYNAPIAFG